MSKIAWKLTENEKKEIEEIFEKKKALENLMKILNEKNEIYDIILKDYSDTLTIFEDWWKVNMNKNGYEKFSNLYVDFTNCQVLIDE